MAGQVKKNQVEGESLVTYVHTAMEILAKGAPAAAQSLVDLSAGAKSEFVRMQASTSVLSRVGLGEKIDVGFTAREMFGGEGSDVAQQTAVELLKKRLDALRNQQLAAAAQEESTVIIEGELEDEPDNVLQLFPLDNLPPDIPLEDEDDWQDPNYNPED